MAWIAEQQNGTAQLLKYLACRAADAEAGEHLHLLVGRHPLRALALHARHGQVNHLYNLAVDIGQNRSAKPLDGAVAAGRDSQDKMSAWR